MLPDKSGSSKVYEVSAGTVPYPKTVNDKDTVPYS